MLTAPVAYRAPLQLTMTETERNQIRETSAQLAADLVESLKQQNDMPSILVLNHFRKLIATLAPTLAGKSEAEFSDAVMELLNEIVVEQKYGPNWRARLKEDPFLFVDFEAIDELLEGLASRKLINQPQKDDLLIGLSAVAERDGNIDIDRLKGCLRVVLEKNLGFSPDTIQSAYDAYLTDDEIKAIAEESIRDVLERRGAGLN